MSALEDPKSKPSIFGVFNVFIDPVATARSVPAPYAWLLPLAIFCVAFAIYNWLNIPLTMRVMALNPPPNASGEQLERIRSITEMSLKVGTFVGPLFIIGITALLALLTNLMATAMSMKTRFRDVFTLMSAVSLIGVLQLIAGFIVLRAKGDDIQSMQQLRPSFGLDIFFPDLKGPAFAILNFFSIFEIWSLVMLALSLAALTKSSKGKAFAAITPWWFVTLLFAVVGSLFQRG